MTINDEKYGLDSDANRVLMGLSAKETREFEVLEEIISIADPVAPISSDEWYSPNERRWLELYEKHRSALEVFLKIAKTRN